MQTRANPDGTCRFYDMTPEEQEYIDLAIADVYVRILKSPIHKQMSEELDKALGEVIQQFRDEVRKNENHV